MTPHLSHLFSLTLPPAMLSTNNFPNYILLVSAKAKQKALLIRCCYALGRRACYINLLFNPFQVSVRIHFESGLLFILFIKKSQPAGTVHNLDQCLVIIIDHTVIALGKINLSG